MTNLHFLSNPFYQKNRYINCVIFYISFIYYAYLKYPSSFKKVENYKEKKDWKKSDELRDEIKKKGWNIKDTKEGWEAERG